MHSKLTALQANLVDLNPLQTMAHNNGLRHPQIWFLRDWCLLTTLMTVTKFPKIKFTPSRLYCSSCITMTAAPRKCIHWWWQCHFLSKQDSSFLRTAYLGQNVTQALNNFHHLNLLKAVADPGFPITRGAKPRVCANIWQDATYWKPQENERNWTERRGARP